MAAVDPHKRGNLAPTNARCTGVSYADFFKMGIENVFSRDTQILLFTISSHDSGLTRSAKYIGCQGLFELWDGLIKTTGPIPVQGRPHIVLADVNHLNAAGKRQAMAWFMNDPMVNPTDPKWQMNLFIAFSIAKNALAEAAMELVLKDDGTESVEEIAYLMNLGLVLSRMASADLMVRYGPPVMSQDTLAGKYLTMPEARDEGQRMAALSLLLRNIIQPVHYKVWLENVLDHVQKRYKKSTPTGAAAADHSEGQEQRKDNNERGWIMMYYHYLTSPDCTMSLFAAAKKMRDFSRGNKELSLAGMTYKFLMETGLDKILGIPDLSAIDSYLNDRDATKNVWESYLERSSYVPTRSELGTEALFTIASVPIESQEGGTTKIVCSSNRWETVRTVKPGAGLCWKVSVEKNPRIAWAGEAKESNGAYVRFTTCRPADLGSREAFPKGEPGYSSSGYAVINDSFAMHKAVGEEQKGQPFFVACLDNTIRVLQKGELLFSAQCPTDRHVMICFKNITRVTVQPVQYMDCFVS